MIPSSYDFFDAVDLKLTDSIHFFFYTVPQNAIKNPRFLPDSLLLKEKHRSLSGGKSGDLLDEIQDIKTEVNSANLWGSPPYTLEITTFSVIHKLQPLRTSSERS